MHVLIYISCTQIELGKRKKNTTTTKDAKKHRRTEELQVPAVSDQVNEPGGITKNFPFPTVGDYVALKCEKYKEFLPQIAKVRNINEADITVDWLNGSYGDVWTSWKYRGKVIVETFPRRAIIGGIKLTASMRLKTPLVDLLKEIYTTTEFV